MALIIESFRGDGDVDEMRKRRGKREASTSTALRGRHAGLLVVISASIKRTARCVVLQRSVRRPRRRRRYDYRRLHRPTIRLSTDAD